MGWGCSNAGPGRPTPSERIRRRAKRLLLRPNCGNLWGVEDLDCLSRYDGLLQFRINGLGAWCLGLTQKCVPAPPEVRAVLQVLANGESASSHW